MTIPSMINVPIPAIFYILLDL